MNLHLSLKTVGRQPWLPILILIVVVCFNHVWRLPELCLRGEETRRAQVGAEMLRTGDWLIPRQQGQIYTAKPPLIGWVIALTTLLRGQFDVWSVRLPSVLATLLTVLLIHGYARNWLSTWGAFSAALSYATMAEIIKGGGQGELEPLFTLFVAGSLLLWHLGYSRHRHPLWVWGLSYVLVTLGMLTKGIQAPLYFCGATFVFLLWQRDWRYLLHWGHVVGFSLCAGLFSLWLIPYWFAVGPDNVARIFGGDVSRVAVQRFQWGALARHLLSYPVEIWLCMLPWSVLGLAFLHRSVRTNLGTIRPLVLFSAVCLLIAFPSCWLSTAAVSRYYRPLYPMAALLFGVVVQLIAENRVGLVVQQLWRGGVAASAMVVAALGIAFALITWLWKMPSVWVQPHGAAIAYVVMAAILAIGLWLCRRPGSVRVYIAVSSMAVFMCVTMTIIHVNIRGKLSRDIPGSVAKMKASLPHNSKLVSFGKIHHKVVFYYGEHIPTRPWPRKNDEVVSAGKYFCFWKRRSAPTPSLPFRWEAVAEIPTSRFWNERTNDLVVVGKRVD